MQFAKHLVRQFPRYDYPAPPQDAVTLNNVGLVLLHKGMSSFGTFAGYHVLKAISTLINTGLIKVAAATYLLYLDRQCLQLGYVEDNRVMRVANGNIVRQRRTK